MQRVRDRLPDAIADREDAVALFASRFGDAENERLFVAHLDSAQRLIALCRHDAADPQQIEFPLRAIVFDALSLGTAGLIVAHNHPSGDPTPSAADLEVTRRLVLVARALRLAVLDHFVFAAESFVSFRELGLL